MSSIIRWRNGLMGFLDIESSCLAWGCEPHDLETGLGFLVCPYPHPLSARSPPLPRERFSRVPGMFSSLEVEVLYPT